MKHLHPALALTLALTLTALLTLGVDTATLAATTASTPATPAPVEWTAIGGNPDITFYADMASLETHGGTATMWTLVGSKTERSQGAIRFSSIRTRFEFDCAGARVRDLETHFHAGPKADGGVVAGYAEPSPWEALAEGTIKEALAQIACPAPDSKPSPQAEK